ncbi:hypothetical protein GCM10023322_22720 [Rugosimonospora acidiphila]|uniref:Integral membrane protein n=1 Tax=Rugosimonospora acidiphila TaxID=556531 RepID=A0ABP9RQP5_9ACTN
MVSEPKISDRASLRWAILLLLVEAAGVVVASGLLAYYATTQPTVGVSSTIISVAFPFALAVVLALLAWQLRRRQAWARGPSIVLELLMVPIGYYMVAGGATWIGVPVMILGLLGAGLLLAPSSREALGIH